MTIQSDNWIKKMAARSMIKPFISKQVQEKENFFQDFFHLSDTMRECQMNLKFLPMLTLALSIQKHLKRTVLLQREVKCIIPPNSFALLGQVEYFKIPDDVLVICLGKSTYARCGIIINVTPLEPSWEGRVTLRFSNTTPLPAKIYAYEGVAQFIFIRGKEKPTVTYSKRKEST